MKKLTLEDLEFWSGENNNELIELLLRLLNGEQTTESARSDIIDTE